MGQGEGTHHMYLWPDYVNWWTKTGRNVCAILIAKNTFAKHYSYLQYRVLKSCYISAKSNSPHSSVPMFLVNSYLPHLSQLEPITTIRRYLTYAVDNAYLNQQIINNNFQPGSGCKTFGPLTKKSNKTKGTLADTFLRKLTSLQLTKRPKASSGNTII
jgi:hypothetical protein